MSAPQWVRQATVLWVIEGEHSRCEDVGGAHVVTAAYAQSIANAPQLPTRMRELRARGATVKAQDGAAPELRAAARRLRARLAVASPASLAEVAQDLEQPELARALATWPPTTSLTFASLATALISQAGTEPLSRTSRLLLALENLV